jgi:hypothetical protein
MFRFGVCAPEKRRLHRGDHRWWATKRTGDLQLASSWDTKVDCVHKMTTLIFLHLHAIRMLKSFKTYPTKLPTIGKTNTWT